MKSRFFHSLFCIILFSHYALAQVANSETQPKVEGVEPAVQAEDPAKVNEPAVMPVAKPVVNPSVPVNKNEPKILEAPKKVKSIWAGAVIWLAPGLGSPGNHLNFPSTHTELGLDLQYFDRVKIGPYYAKTSANKSEYFTFPTTGYDETRYYNVTSQVLGIQARGQAYETLHGRIGVGLSQTKFTVTKVETGAPIASSALGYSKTYPLGLALEVALQKNWSWQDWGVGVEWGLNVTSVFSNESFSEKYVAVVGRYFFGRAKSAPTFIKKVAGQGLTEPVATESKSADPVSAEPTMEPQSKPETELPAQ